MSTAGWTRIPPMAQTWLAPVGLRLHGEALEWLPHESLKRGGTIAPQPRLLDDFLALHGQDDDRVLDFAQEHGVLGLGDDGRPWAVSAAKRWYGPGKYARENLSGWRTHLQAARDVLHVAGKLARRERLTDHDRLPILRLAWPDEPGPLLGEAHETPLGLAFDPAPDDDTHLLLFANRTVQDDRQTLCWAVGNLLQQAGAGVVLEWPSDARQPRMTLGGQQRGCLAAIAVQVALACTRAETTATCSGCGQLYAPAQPPRPGLRHFCERCRRSGVPAKLANRDRRARERARQRNEGEQER